MGPSHLPSFSSLWWPSNTWPPHPRAVRNVARGVSMTILCAQTVAGSLTSMMKTMTMARTNLNPNQNCLGAPEMICTVLAVDGAPRGGW